MVPRGIRVLGLVSCTVLGGCGGGAEGPPETARLEVTPPEVAARYQALVDELDEGLPGAAVARLENFRERNSGFEVARLAEEEIGRFRSLANGRYHLARELARDGEFDRARSVLEDLGTHLPDTADGESARRHLETGDFDVGQAQWLASRQRWKESERVARAALERGVRGPGAEQLERILDNAGMVSAARSTAARTQVMAACRQVMIVLEVTMADQGEYPARFSLADVEAYDAVGSRGIRHSLSAVEGYRRTAGAYDLVCVGTDGENRVRVVGGELAP